MNNDEIKNIIREILEKLDITIESVGEEAIGETDNSPIFMIKTPDAHNLIGRDGTTLQALNHIVNRIVFAKNPDAKRFTIDVNNYYKEALEKIKQKARFAADRARSYKTKIELEPMNSFERLVVHSLFPEGGDIQTRSEGVGHDRRIVLTYTGD